MKSHKIILIIITIILAFCFCKKTSNTKTKTIKASITHNHVLIRSRATTKARILGKMYKGNIVTILDRTKYKVKIGKWYAYWYKIKTKYGKTGWTYGAFVSIKDTGYSTQISIINRKAIDKRFIDNGDGSITDTQTGLSWQCVLAKKDMNWFEADKYRKNLKLGGYNDWRLPISQEFKFFLYILTAPKFKHIRKRFKNLKKSTVFLTTGFRTKALYSVVYPHGDTYPLEISIKQRYSIILVRGISKSKTAIITKNKVIVRQKPHIRSKVAEYVITPNPGIRIKNKLELHKDEIIYVLKKSDKTAQVSKWNDYWYKIKTMMGYTGWVFGAYLLKSGEKRNVDYNKRFVNNENGTITDKRTRLMWQRITPYFNGKKNWHDAKKYCENLVLADYTDWRLPTIDELKNLIRYGSEPYNSWLKKQGFENLGSYSYWSSSIPSGWPSSAYRLYLPHGSTNHYSSKTSKLYYFAVRRANNKKRFKNFGSNIIVDTKTGLMWQRVMLKEPINWADANIHCKKLKLGGYKDWRLPTKKELKSLVTDVAFPHSKYLNEEDFVGFKKYQSYWTSVIDEPNKNRIWCMEIKNCEYFVTPKNNRNYVIAVRSYK